MTTATTDPTDPEPEPTGEVIGFRASYPVVTGDCDEWVRDAYTVSVVYDDDDIRSLSANTVAVFAEAQDAVHWLVARGCPGLKAQQMLSELMEYKFDVLRAFSWGATRAPNSDYHEVKAGWKRELCRIHRRVCDRGFDD